jgi:hypothetical protein
MTEHRLNLSALAESLKNGAHSIFSASGSPLWLNCSGGLIANILAKDDSGVDAAEGTVAHGVCELWLRTDKKPKQLVGTRQRVKNGDEWHVIEITDTMLDYCQMYVDACDWIPGEHYIETKVYYDAITPIPNQGGTADHAACSWQKLTITDFKYGKGHAVHAENNTQALLYALGFFYEFDWLYDFQEINIRIVQPRMDIFETWTITREFLLEWAEYARVRAHLAWRLDAPRTAGSKQCLFCRVKTDCAANIQMQEDIVTAAFADLFQPIAPEREEALKQRLDDGIFTKYMEPHRISVENMAFMLKFRPMVERWWKALHNELTRRAINGIVVPGKKLVEGRTHRQFTHIERAVKALDAYGIEREELVKETIESPAEVERLLRKHGVHAAADIEKILKPLVYKPPGKATLVDASDRRPAIVDVSEIAFADLLDENCETDDL